MRHSYFCFEGPDFCGKSTIAGLVFQKLYEMNPNMFLLTKEPGSIYSPLCTKIRDIVQNTEITDEIVYAGLFDIDRRVHLKDVVEPAINKNKIVLSDRCIISSICYQEKEIRELREENNSFFLSLNPYIFFIVADKDVLLSRSLYRSMTTIEKNIFSDRIDNILGKYNNVVLNYNHEIIKNNDCSDDNFNNIINYISSKIIQLSTGITL